MQKGIELFRKHLAIILHDHVFNENKETPVYDESNNTEDNSDVLMWDKNDPLPTEVSRASQIPNDPALSLLWTWVHCIKAGVAAWEESMKEKYCKSPLGKYRIRKESTCIRKSLMSPIVLGEVKGLWIHYIRMSCI